MGKSQQGYLDVSVNLAITLTARIAGRVLVNVDSYSNANGDSSMSPRPKRISDDELIQTAAAVVAERGAGHTRFVDVAAASGLAPATLVQRFGTLDALLDAIGRVFTAELAAAFALPAASPVRRLAAALTWVALSPHLPFLLLRPAAAPRYSLELRKHIAFCLAAAIERGELPHGDVAHQAREIQLRFYGQATAALFEGTAVGEAEVAALIGAVLGDVL